MSLPPSIAGRLRLPAFCAPMFLVSTPELVKAACLSGIIGGLPRQNARSIEQFEAWLADIRLALDVARDQGAAAGPLAVNLASNLPTEELAANLALCARYGVDIIVNATGDPTELTKRARDAGMLVYADAVNLRFAEKAASAGVDGITAVGAGGGGHSGVITPLALIPKIRAMFSGTIVLAGAVSSGAAIRAAEILGADLAYLGTRFIATRESGADPAYKQMLIDEDIVGVVHTAAISGVAASWLTASMRRVGLDPDALPAPGPRLTHGHLPAGVKPWRNLWSAGQGIGLIADAPDVAEIVERLASEYEAACDVPAFRGWKAS